MFFVYAIKNQKDKIYVGYTIDLAKRIDRHNGKLKNKKTSYTSRNAGKWELIYVEECETRNDSIKREKQLKSYQGRKFIRNKIK